MTGTRSLLLISLIVGLVIAPTSSIGEEVRRYPPAFQLRAIELKLVDYRTGDISRDVFRGDRGAFWNTIIGGGDAGGHYDDGLLLIKYKINRIGQGDSATIRVIARTNRGVILNRERTVHAISGTDGYAHAPFFIYGIGCAGDLSISTSLRQSGARTQYVSDTIVFRCGE